jgi:hypothetical protein
MNENEKKYLIIISLLLLAQALLFVAYVNREVAWNYILHGDPTWYTYFSYKVFDAVVHRDWSVVWNQAVTSPWGVLLFLQSVVPQLLFGPSRVSVLSVNLFYYCMAQVITYYFFCKVTRSHIGGFVGLALFLTMNTPFRKGQPDLNIADVHFDLVFFFLIVVIYYLIAWSNSFRKLLPSLLIGAFGAFIVANRLVGVFLFIGVFGAFLLLFVALYYYHPDGGFKVSCIERVRNLLFASIAFVFLSLIPILIARKALYDHYFRYIFDSQFIKEREGLYVMGANSKVEEAYNIISSMLDGDFGTVFWIAIAVILTITVWGSVLRKEDKTAPLSKNTIIENITTKWSLSELLLIKGDKRLYIWFLLLAISVSYIQHIVFPIKSDHLTRMTAAPLFILLCVVLLPHIVNMYQSRLNNLRYAAIGGSLIIFALAAFNHVSFYSGTGRYSNAKSDGLRVAELYDDISQIVLHRSLKELSISVDFLDTYELGAMMSYFTYAYEHHRLMLTPRPKLGGINDEPVTLGRAKQLLSGSDVVLLTRLNPNTRFNEFFPFMKSVKEIQPAIRDFVRENFCFNKSYHMFGVYKDLYVRPPKIWTLSASASTKPRFGPDRLLDEVGQIWHAPWANGISQWLRFDAAKPVILEGIEIISQDGAPDRAPREFALEGSADGRNWEVLLRVVDAVFTLDRPSLKWKIKQLRSMHHYRLIVTKNGGHTNLMTIQGIHLQTNNKLFCDVDDKFSGPLRRGSGRGEHV